MSVSFNIKRQAVVDGKTYGESRTLSADRGLTVEKSIPVAKSGTLTTRTDNDTGVITFAAGHGFVNGDRVDLYWNIAGVLGSRRGITAAMTGDTMAVDVGAGDNLPIATSTIIVCKAPAFEFQLTGNSLVGLAIFAEARCTVVIAQAGGTEIYAYSGKIAGVSRIWATDDAETNPLAGGAVGKVYLSHADTTGAKVVRVGAAVN
jgi:hypothetical protein